MKTLEDLYDYTFNKYVFSDSFHLPASISDLRTFTEKLCKDIVQKISQKKGSNFAIAEDPLSLSVLESGSSLHQKSLNQSKALMKNSPIGLDSLSKTFNIINIVVKGTFLAIHFPCIIKLYF